VLSWLGMADKKVCSQLPILNIVVLLLQMLEYLL